MPEEKLIILTDVNSESNVSLLETSKKIKIFNAYLEGRYSMDGFSVFDLNTDQLLKAYLLNDGPGDKKISNVRAELNTDLQEKINNLTKDSIDSFSDIRSEMVSLYKNFDVDAVVSSLFDDIMAVLSKQNIKIISNNENKLKIALRTYIFNKLSSDLSLKLAELSIKKENLLHQSRLDLEQAQQSIQERRQNKLAENQKKKEEQISRLKESIAAWFSTRNAEVDDQKVNAFLNKYKRVGSEFTSNGEFASVSLFLDSIYSNYQTQQNLPVTAQRDQLVSMMSGIFNPSTYGPPSSET